MKNVYVCPVCYTAYCYTRSIPKCFIDNEDCTYIQNMFVRVNKYFDTPVDENNPFEIIRGMETDKLGAVSKRRRNIRSHLFVVHGISTDDYVIDDTLKVFSLLGKIGLLWSHIRKKNVTQDETLWTRENMVLYLEIINRKGKWKDPPSSMCVHFLKEATDAFLNTNKFEKIQRETETVNVKQEEDDTGYGESDYLTDEEDDYESSVDWRRCLSVVIRENIHRKHEPAHVHRKIRPESISSSSSSYYDYDEEEEEEEDEDEDEESLQSTKSVYSTCSEFSSKEAELERLAAEKRKRKRIIISDEEDE